MPEFELGGVTRGDRTCNFKGYCRVADHKNKWEVKIHFGKDKEGIYKKK